MSVTEPGQTTRPPHWDMTTVFASLDAPEVEQELQTVVREIRELGELFDLHGVRGLGEPSAPSEAFEACTRRLNDLRERVRTLSGYISTFVSTDSRNDLAQARMSELQQELVELSRLSTRYQAWVGSMDVDALLERSQTAAEHELAVRRAVVAARHQMTEPEEDLSASLHPSGQGAWARLHGNVTSRLAVEVSKPDGAVTLPMSAVRGLAHDPDERVRRAAYEAELGVWKQSEVPIAAALNGIKGTVHTLNARRGWPDSLEPALFTNNVDRQTLDAMHTACVESFPDFRRYLQTKARLLGKTTLAWWDLFAPVGSADRHWDYGDATDFIVEQFGTYSDRLSALAKRAFTESWVDAEPRDGKRDGAFCMALRRDESRVMLNFTPAFSSVSTMAHELGHAYHNMNLASRTPMQRETPMALAETASIFCQTIVTNAMLAHAPESEKLAVLEGDLQNACQIVVDIHSRFWFEQAVFERRAKRELSASELCELMLDAQRRTYGDGLDGDTLHPYMWAVKPHYYSTSYYNWPYTFGMLFGLGLYARYRQDPEAFRAGYDDLLSSTGIADAATLAGRFGIDVRSPDFWRSSLDQVRDRIAELETLAG